MDMTNTHQQKVPAYRNKISADTFDDLKEKILKALVVEKKYKEKNFSAKKLAESLHTNTRYVSIVLSVRYQSNYTSFVNKLRVEEAMSLLVDKRYVSYKIEDISDMVGFANRQSFYRAFCSIAGMTPRTYQKINMLEENSELINSKINKNEL